MAFSTSSRHRHLPELRVGSSPPSTSHYLVVIFLLQLGAAILLLINRYVPLALTLLGPIVVNILFFHLLMAPSGLPLAVTVAVLWAITAFSVRSAFRGLFQKTYRTVQTGAI